MKEYTISRDTELTPDELGKILRDYQAAVEPILDKRKSYYDGRHKILSKEFQNSNRTPSRVVCNFIKSIVDSYSGYAVGIPPRIESAESGDVLDDILNYNDSDEQLCSLFTDGLIYGRAASIAYIDGEGKTRFSVISPERIVPIYSDDLERVLLYVARYWETQETAVDQTRYHVELYGEATVKEYDSTAGFTTVSLIGERSHNFDQVPVVIFSLNRDETGVCDDSIFSLNEAYNEILSDVNDSENQFADAMLVLKGQFAEEEDIESMKRNRVLMMDSDADASYLIKDVSGTQADSLLDRIEAKIRNHTGCPDFNSDEFRSASGVAIRYRLLAMENVTAKALTRFKKALQKLIELIAGVERLKNAETVWRDVKITFERNLPIDDTANAQVVATLKGTVSDETLLGLLPFVDNPSDEAKRVEEQNKRNMELYLMPEDDTDGDEEQR